MKLPSTRVIKWVGIIAFMLAGWKCYHMQLDFKDCVEHDVPSYEYRPTQAEKGAICIGFSVVLTLWLMMCRASERNEEE